MTPYYTSPNGQIAIYHGDSREMLPTFDPADVGLVLTDPPYGISLDTANHSRGRSRPVRADGSRNMAVALSTDYPPVFGDDAPFDPLPLLRFRRLILFGGNYFAERLPPSPSWLVWDKIAGLIAKKRSLGVSDGADAELIWTNLGGPVRILRHQWLGLFKATERDQARVHPTQKPVALMRWLIDRYSAPGDLILDPYLGAGSTAIAAQDMGRRCIGIEFEERYCEIAVRRLAQQPLPLETLGAARLRADAPMFADVEAS